MLDIKPTETSILHVNNNSFTGPLINGAFEKRAPAPLWRIRKVYVQGSTVRHFVLVTNQNSSFSKGVRLRYLLKTCLLTKLG